MFYVLCVTSLTLHRLIEQFLKRKTHDKHMTMRAKPSWCSLSILPKQTARPKVHATNMNEDGLKTVSWSRSQSVLNRVRRQSGFPTFIIAQRHYVRTSATRYRCGDNRTKVKTFVTSAWYHWWHVGPCFGPYLTCGFARGRRTLLSPLLFSYYDDCTKIIL